MGGKEQKCPIYISRIIPGGYAEKYDIYCIVHCVRSFIYPCTVPFTFTFVYVRVHGTTLLCLHIHV